MPLSANSLLVAGLLQVCSPSAITWFVVAVIVYAINRVARSGAITHVSAERSKASEPLIAHGYATRTVMLVAVVIRVIATLLHVGPSFVLRRFRFAMSTAKHPGRTPFCVQAAARHDRAASQVAANLNGLLAAGTLAKPLSSVDSIATRAANNGQSTEDLSRQIAHSHYSRLYSYAVIG